MSKIKKSYLPEAAFKAILSIAFHILTIMYVSNLRNSSPTLRQSLYVGPKRKFRSMSGEPCKK